MIDIKEYIKTKRDYRLKGEIYGRKPVYIHGEVSLKETLEMLEKLGKPEVILECTKGKKTVVWDRFGGWSRLEKLL